MSNADTASTTEEWYARYHQRKGSDRNDMLRNPGVMFQAFAFQKCLLEALRETPIQPTWNLLDVGCGDGGSLEQFLTLGFAPTNLHGIDILPERIRQGADKYSHVDFVCGDATKMSWPSGAFDLVMAATMFIQIRDERLAQSVAAEMVRVTRPGGYLLLIDWRYDFWRPEYLALNRRRIHTLFDVGGTTGVFCRRHGALVPPIGRFLSRRLPSAYFSVQKLLPFLVGQVATLLQKQ